MNLKSLVILGGLGTVALASGWVYLSQSSDAEEASQQELTYAETEQLEKIPVIPVGYHCSMPFQRGRTGQINRV